MAGVDSVFSLKVLPSESPGVGSLRFLPSFEDLNNHQINVIPDDSIPSKNPGLISLCLMPSFEERECNEALAVSAKLWDCRTRSGNGPLM